MNIFVLCVFSPKCLLLRVLLILPYSKSLLFFKVHFISLAP